MDKILSSSGTVKLNRKVVEDIANKKYVTVVSAKSISGGNIAVVVNGASAPIIFASQIASQLLISNISGTAIEVLQDGSGVYFPIPTGAMVTFQGISNANQLAIRRVDLAATSVTISARWEL